MPYTNTCVCKAILKDSATVEGLLTFWFAHGVVNPRSDLEWVAFRARDIWQTLARSHMEPPMFRVQPGFTHDINIEPDRYRLRSSLAAFFNFFWSLLLGPSDSPPGL